MYNMESLPTPYRPPKAEKAAAEDAGGDDGADAGGDDDEWVLDFRDSYAGWENK